MDTFKQIIKDFRKGENITWLATIILVIITLVLKGLGIASDAMVSSITLAMLGILATGFLVLRYKIEEIVGQRSSILDLKNTVCLLDKFPVLLDEYLEKADEIIMLGVILRTTTYTYYDEFKSRVKRGLKLRVLITNPYSQHIDIDQITDRFSRGETTDLFRAAYDTILEQYKRIRASAVDADNVQLRLLDFVPPFSIYIFPAEKDGGAIFVQIYAHKAPEGATPRFLVTERDNPIWYRRFCQLFENMWEDGIDYFSQ